MNSQIKELGIKCDNKSIAVMNKKHESRWLDNGGEEVFFIIESGLIPQVIDKIIVNTAVSKEIIGGIFYVLENSHLVSLFFLNQPLDQVKYCL